MKLGHYPNRPRHPRRLQAGRQQRRQGKPPRQGRQLAAVALEAESSQLVLRLDADAGDGIAAVERVAPARITGTVPVCSLRISYLADALARLPDVAWVEFQFTDETGESLAGIQGWQAGNTGLLAMVMPCRV